MRALTISPGVKDSARLDADYPEPAPEEGPVLVEAMAVGVCGTDHELAEGAYGWSPPGSDRLVIGHESLGKVVEAPANSGLAKGDLVVGIVRHPDPVPCSNCAVGEWDMCRNGRYTERGIKERDGFCRERYRLDAAFAVRLDPALGILGVLLEPATILAKAWEHIEHIGRRARWDPRRVLVTGAGPVGLLAALMGVQRGLEVHVLDRVTSGPKPDLVRALGATYHSTSIKDAGGEASDIIIECTGVGQLILDAMQFSGHDSVVCLAGLSPHRERVPFDPGAMNQRMVLENNVVFGTVNANRRHYEKAAESLAKADRGWLQRLLTRRVPLDRWADALAYRDGDVKTVIDFTR